MASYDVTLRCPSARARGLDACSFHKRLTGRDVLTTRAAHADLINQGPQVARAPDQRVEAVGPTHELGSGACWPRDARIIMPILGLPCVDERLLGINMFSFRIMESRSRLLKRRL